MPRSRDSGISAVFSFQYNHLTLPVLGSTPSLPSATPIMVGADASGNLLLFWSNSDAAKTLWAALLLPDGTWNEGPALADQSSEEGLQRRNAYMNQEAIAPNYTHYLVVSDMLLNDQAAAIRAFALLAKRKASVVYTVMPHGENFAFSPLRSDKEIESIKAMWALARMCDPRVPKPSQEPSLVNHATALATFEEAFEAHLANG